MSMFLQRYSIFFRLVKPLIFFGLIGLSYLMFVTYNGTPKEQRPFHEHRNDILITSPWGEVLKTQVADTFRSRQTGLSNHTSLSKNQAMLFIFNTSDIQPFWMKDMDFPIDIFWLNENKEIVFIQKNASPEDYPKSYYPNKKALYAIETVAGMADDNDIVLGQKFTWDD